MMSDPGKQKEIDKLKDMIMHEFYIENQKSLIDTLASYGELARAALLEVIRKLDNVQAKEYASMKLETMG